MWLFKLLNLKLLLIKLIKIIINKINKNCIKINKNYYFPSAIIGINDLAIILSCMWKHYNHPTICMAPLPEGSPWQCGPGFKSYP